MERLSHGSHRAATAESQWDPDGMLWHISIGLEILRWKFNNYLYNSDLTRSDKCFLQETLSPMSIFFQQP